MLYRGMHLDEYDELMKTEKWAGGNGSMEGKWFAESYKDAVTWGKRMGHSGNFQVVQIHVPDRVANAAYSVKNLDNIGNARYIEVTDLNKVQAKPQWTKLISVSSC
ncbi:hypothetical protein AB204_06760 [Xenorhabdus khoisanae]|uniref:Uncharacterized protein n=2 Tax=Xenorhabdus khoisanae TaxID=880157 RepID=A0A0J5FVC3_9GAMM|nr:hypothetical protein AB204_06760 [Xenorhabdus khoisanae]